MATRHRVLRLVAAMCVPVVSAMYGSVAFDADSYAVGTVFTFDFYAGGALTLAVTASGPAAPVGRDGAFVWVGVCSDDELSRNILKYRSGREVCAANLTAACTRSSSLPTAHGPSNWSTTSLPITTAGLRYIVFAGCSDSSQHVAASWHAVNPGGEELPANQVPLKALSVGFGAAWVAGGVLLALNLGFASVRHVRPPSWDADPALAEPQLASPIRRLHWALLIPPALFLTEGFVGGAFWRRVSVTGRGDLTLGILDVAALDFATASLMCLLLLLARGWQLTRLRLSPVEYRATGGLVALYVVAWGSWSFSTSFLSLFLLLLAYMCVLRYCFASATWGMALLQQFRAFTASLSGGGGAGQGVAAGAAREGQYVAEGSYQSMGGSERGGGDGSVNDASRVANPAPPHTPSLLSRANAWVRSLFPPGPYAQLTAHEEGGAHVQGQPPPLVDGGLAVVQLRFLRKFRLLVASYLSLTMMAEIISDVATSIVGVPWMAYTLQQVAALGLWAYLALLLRARADPRDSPLYDPRGYVGAMGEGLLPEHRALYVAAGGREEDLVGGGGGAGAASAASGAVVLLHPSRGGGTNSKEHLSLAEPVGAGAAWGGGGGSGGVASSQQVGGTFAAPPIRPPSTDAPGQTYMYAAF